MVKEKAKEVRRATNVRSLHYVTRNRGFNE